MHSGRSGTYLSWRSDGGCMGWDVRQHQGGCANLCSLSNLDVAKDAGSRSNKNLQRKNSQMMSHMRKKGSMMQDTFRGP